MQTELKHTFYLRVNRTRIAIEKKMAVSSRVGAVLAKGMFTIDIPGDLACKNRVMSRIHYILDFLKAVCAPYDFEIMELSGGLDFADVVIRILKSDYKVIRYGRLKENEN